MYVHRGRFLESLEYVLVLETEMALLNLTTSSCSAIQSVCP